MPFGLHEMQSPGGRQRQKQPCSLPALLNPRASSKLLASGSLFQMCAHTPSPNLSARQELQSPQPFLWEGCASLCSGATPQCGPPTGPSGANRKLLTQCQASVGQRPAWWDHRGPYPTRREGLFPQLSHAEAKIAVGRWLGLLFHGGLLATYPPALPLLRVTWAAPGAGMENQPDLCSVKAFSSAWPRPLWGSGCRWLNGLHPPKRTCWASCQTAERGMFGARLDGSCLNRLSCCQETAVCLWVLTMHSGPGLGVLFPGCPCRERTRAGPARPS